MKPPQKHRYSYCSYWCYLTRRRLCRKDPVQVAIERWNKD